ncbi:hypothetical protein D9M71_810370 [compost metagenome]
MQGPFVRQAPAGLPTAVQVQLQLILQNKPLLQHPSILFGIARPQLRRKNLGTGFSKQGLQVFQPAATHQGAVGHDVARLDILDKDRGIGNDIQHRQQQCHACQ